jgi:uncharacterized protein YceH (UPF0502 family)
MKIKTKKFEKLVRENALFEERFNFLNEQTKDMLADMQELESENEELKVLNVDLMAQIEELEEKLEKIKADVQEIKEEQEERCDSE